MIHEFADPVSCYGCSHRFLHGQKRPWRKICIARIRKSLEFDLGSHSYILPDLQFLLLVQTTIFAGFSYALI